MGYPAGYFEDGGCVEINPNKLLSVSEIVVDDFHLHQYHSIFGVIICGGLYRRPWRNQHKSNDLIVPVGHIWKFDLEEYEIRNFGMKFTFFKNSI